MNEKEVFTVEFKNWDAVSELCRAVETSEAIVSILFESYFCEMTQLNETFGEDVARRIDWLLTDVYMHMCKASEILKAAGL